MALHKEPILEASEGIHCPFSPREENLGCFGWQAFLECLEGILSPRQ